MRAALLALVLTVSSCLPSVATVPVTPTNQAQVTACQNISTAHNDIVVGDFVIGGSAPVLAGIGVGLAPSDPGAGKALGIAATVAGALAATGAGLAAMESSSYASNNCSQVVGVLPVLPAMSKLPPADAGAK